MKTTYRASMIVAIFMTALFSAALCAMGPISPAVRSDGVVTEDLLSGHNDPRIGESALMMTALRAQNKLAMAAWNGMTDTNAGDDEVTAVRTQLAAITKGTLPADVAAAAKDLDAKLTTFGGAVVQGGRGGGGFGGAAPRAPGSILAFRAINTTFYTVLGPLSQNGIDMPPTPAMIHTWESGCRELTGTANAWKTMIETDLATFNSLLSKNNLTPLKLTPTAVTAPASCTFAGPARTAARK